MIATVFTAFAPVVLLPLFGWYWTGAAYTVLYLLFALELRSSERH